MGTTKKKMATARILTAGVLCAAWGIVIAGCASMDKSNVEYPKVASVRLLTLDPGHFHASLVQKSMYLDVDPLVHVYAPGGATEDDLNEHLKRIETFNTRADNPTHWQEQVYTGPDYLEKMLSEKAGNLVVIAGNSAKRTDYVLKCLQNGFNVLADKPMAISEKDFDQLRQAFAAGIENHAMVYDIMTERFEITTILQRELSQQPGLFGHLLKGTETDPAISMASVHYFSKTVADSPLKRPAWFYDVRQEGEGIVDVATHLVDLIQWEAFPGKALTPADSHVTSARHWTTPITLAQFQKTTGETQFPDFLKQDVQDGVLQVYSNGEFAYQLNDIWCKVKVTWDFEAIAGGDTHYSNMRGSKARLVIKQGSAEGYKPMLYVEKNPNAPIDDNIFEGQLKQAIKDLQAKYPGIGYQKAGLSWLITVPEKYDVGHEAHAAQVTRNFLRYLREGKMPAWELPNMVTKYDTLWQAYKLSR